MSFISPHHSLDEIKRDVLAALKKAGHDRNSALRYVSLATIGTDGPNTRYVVIRNFNLADHSLLIYTDYRSHKIKEMKGEPKVAVLAYDTQSKLQVKLKGVATIHYQNELTETHWEDLLGAKEAYQTNKSPGSMVDTPAEGQEMLSEDDGSHFSVVSVKLQTMEVLQLRQEGNIRAKFDLKSSQSTFLVP